MKRGVQSNLRELSITILESFRRLRKFSGRSNSRTRRFARAKTPSSQSDGQGLSSRANARDLRKISPFGRNDKVRPLRLCCAFARGIPTFGCGSIALGLCGGLWMNCLQKPIGGNLFA